MSEKYIKITFTDEGFKTQFHEVGHMEICQAQEYLRGYMRVMTIQMVHRNKKEQEVKDIEDKQSE